MTMITEIREKSGLITIYAEGTVWMKVRKKHFGKLPLHEGDAVEPSEYIDQLAAIQFSDAYEAALTMLDFSARTSTEIKRALVTKGFVSPAAEAAAERLIEAGLIDDKLYASRMAESAARKKTGIYNLRRKLMAKGINEDDAAEALETLDDDQQLAAAKESAAALSRKYAGLERRAARSKLAQALARRGFSWDIISSAIEDVFTED